MEETDQYAGKPIALSLGSGMRFTPFNNRLICASRTVSSCSTAVFNRSPAQLRTLLILESTDTAEGAMGDERGDEAAVSLPPGQYVAVARFCTVNHAICFANEQNNVFA